MRLGKRPRDPVTWLVVRARGRLLHRWGPVRGWVGGRRACGGAVVAVMAVREEPAWCGAAERVRFTGPESSHHGPSHGEWLLPSVHTPRKASVTPGGVR